MTPGDLPLAIYRGDSYRWRFVLWEDTAKTIAADLTNATAKAEFRTAPGGVLLTAMDLTVVLPNTIEAELTADNCQLLTSPVCYWDLQITYSDTGDVQTMLAGKVTITADVTDSTTAGAVRRMRLAG